MDPSPMLPNSSHSSGMSSMAVVFTTAHDTPLFSTGWTPASTAAYAGTCIFLAVLAVISRLLQAYRHLLERKWHQLAVARSYLLVADDLEATQGGERAVRSERGGSGGGEVKNEAPTLQEKRALRGDRQSSRRAKTQRRPWTFGADLPRACVFTVQAGVGYLLMLAVMTLNLGYFLSVLAGLFVGELAVGRFAAADTDDDHHC